MPEQLKSGLPLVTLPTSSLHQSSKKISKFDADLKDLAVKMGVAMYEYNGVGLAAPQIGQNIRLIVITDEKGGYIPYVNPEITFKSKAEVMNEEGCLSVPEVYGYIPRASKIRFSYQDLDGVKHKEKAKGLKAIIIQHECHHLEGTLFVDKAKSFTQGEENYKLMLKN